MKKKVAALLITGIMAVAMTACGSSNSGTDDSGSTDGTAKAESSADAGSDWDNTVIGAGSVVTKDIPANVVAYGTPCKVIREINEHDKEYYFKDRKIEL